ncbi:amino acid ABC transporter permease [Gilliamella sp. A7]|uniref:amino acid ABC transporter permease n=1 Tax=Gilliamella sp. A7 TaxID=1970465 RepID=UPI000A330A13|nr:amino acid ABC transporter permease [Gilliamella sp. A7]OTQ59360.1 hypothetical protein B6D18_04025 [Gilliamella sp. A7]
MTFNWTLFFQSTPYDDGIYFNWLFNSAMVTISLAATAWIIAFILGSIVGIMRTVDSKILNRLAIGYIELFRNIPLFIQIFIWYTIMPLFLTGSFKKWFIQDLDPDIQTFILVSIALGLFTSARIAEQVRTGIQTLPIGQKYAATALGLSKFQTYRYILLPNAYRKIVPTLTSEMTNIIKNSSIASQFGGLRELVGLIASMNDRTNSIIEILCVITITYMIINYSVITIMRFVEKKTRLPNMMSGG